MRLITRNRIGTVLLSAGSPISAVSRDDLIGPVSSARLIQLHAPRSKCRRSRETSIVYEADSCGYDLSRIREVTDGGEFHKP